jgi:hypothetical protein
VDVGVGPEDEPPHGVVDREADDDVLYRFGGVERDLDPHGLVGGGGVLVRRGVHDPDVGDLHPAPHR